MGVVEYITMRQILIMDLLLLISAALVFQANYPVHATGQLRSGVDTACPDVASHCSHALSSRPVITRTSVAGSSSLSMFRKSDMGLLVSSRMRYGIAPHVDAHIEVNQRTAPYPVPGVIGTEGGVSYSADGYSLGLSVAARRLHQRSVPSWLLSCYPKVSALGDFDKSAQFKVQSRLAIGGGSGIELAASIGSIWLLPGNVLGLDTLDQKSLRLGIDHGALSGNIVGRIVKPSDLLPGTSNRNFRWGGIDLGITWRFPWHGALSVGARNVWSSSSHLKHAIDPSRPEQSRTPYVQYHQDL